MISGGTTQVRLYTPAELAELFGISERQLLDWRRMNNWPSVRIGRTIRFTQTQLDEILRRHSETPKAAAAPDTAIAGQSKASAARTKRAS